MSAIEGWERFRGQIGVAAPSWLTFEVHRPYFDGAATERTAIQARGPVVAARLFERRDPFAPRHSMIMPASYRQLLTEESRLERYRVRVPTDLPADLASPAWTQLSVAYAERCDLDRVEVAGLAQWLIAACLPDGVLALAPADHSADDCCDPLTAALQSARATALFQREGLTDRTRAARLPLLEAPRPTLAQVSAYAGWAYTTARHEADDASVQAVAERARDLFHQLAPELSPSERAIRWARLLLRETMHAERTGDFAHAVELLAEAEASRQAAGDEPVSIELRRRLIDRGVEIAVRSGDTSTERALIEEGLALDPYCVKMRMQAAQSAERRKDWPAALAEYLTAARLGPFGTGFALLAGAECARRLGDEDFARGLTERAFRSAPRSERTRDALVETCERAGDEPLAAVAKYASPQPGGKPYENNWHYQLYAAYLNLGESRSPTMYARLPLFAYEFALAGNRPRVSHQRIMPPAFRANLVRESGLSAFAVDDPRELPGALRTPAWEQLCDWIDGFADADEDRRYDVASVLFRLGFHQLCLELLPVTPVENLRTRGEFRLQHLRAMIAYAASAGSSAEAIDASMRMVDRPECPLHLKVVLSVFGVVHHGRRTKSASVAESWRARAQELLDEILAREDYTAFEKVMLESRFYRGASFVPFLRKDRAAVVADLDRAEELARTVPAETEWEQFVARENLHACLESRSKEAFGLKEWDRGHRLTVEFLALDPYDPKSHIEYGESLMRREEYRAAAQSYLRAARLGPLGTAIAYSMAGECYERAGEPALAEDCFVQCLRVDPYAISAARGWARTGGVLAAEYAASLESWGAERQR